MRCALFPFLAFVHKSREQDDSELENSSFGRKSPEHLKFDESFYTRSILVRFQPLENALLKITEDLPILHQGSADDLEQRAFSVVVRMKSLEIPLGSAIPFSPQNA